MYTNKPEAIILCHRRGNITLLWPPYFRPVVSSFFLHSFLPSSFSFFPGLISTVANWMSTIPFTSCGLSTNLGLSSLQLYTLRLKILFTSPHALAVRTGGTSSLLPYDVTQLTCAAWCYGSQSVYSVRSERTAWRSYCELSTLTSRGSTQHVLDGFNCLIV